VTGTPGSDDDGVALAFGGGLRRVGPREQIAERLGSPMVRGDADGQPGLGRGLDALGHDLQAE